MAVTMVVIVATDLDNAVLPGAKLYAYAAGTTTPQAMYTDSGLGTATANPFVCDASGRGVVWLDSSLGDYKLVLKDSGDANTYYSQDNTTVGDNPQIIVYPAGVGDQSLNTGDAPTFSGLTLTGNLDLDGNDLIIDGDADTYLHANADDDVRLVVAGVDELTFNTTGLQPTADDGYQLGGASNRFSNVYASAANVDGDLTITGTVDGRDVSSDGASLDALVSVVGIGDLTSAEVDQLENIDSVTISNAQWGYLGDASAFGGSLMAAADDTAAQALLNVATSATFASQAEAEAGTDTTKSMNALRTAQAIAALESVSSVAAKTGAVTLVKGDVGLGNVDNTADADKPVSTATQTALDLKAPLASPALTGTPTAPTASGGTNTTQIATTAFLQSELDFILDPAASAPTTRRDGGALSGGELWFNTTAANQALQAYIADWGRIAAGITPKSLGAAGDADGAGAGTDDAAALQAAIDLAYNLGWGVVDGEGLWYNFGTKLQLKDGVELRNGKSYWTGGLVANQRLINNGGNAGTYRLKNWTVHRGASKDDNVPDNLTTTAPDTTSHSGIDIRLTSGSTLRVFIEGCEVEGHGVGSGIIVGGATGGYVRNCYVHDMEWNAEAATTPSDVGFSNVQGNDGINGIYFFDCSGLEVNGNVVEDLKVEYDDGTGAASFCLGTRGIAGGVGGGVGNFDCAVFNNTVKRVSQGIDFTGGSATGTNRRNKIYSNTIEDVYTYGIKGANTFQDGMVFGNVIRRPGLGGIVYNSSASNDVPATGQTQNIYTANNAIISAGTMSIDIPADHNSGSGYVKGTHTIFAFGLLELGGTNAGSHPWGCVFANNKVDDRNNKLSYVYHSTVTFNNTIQLAPNQHFGTTYINNTTTPATQDSWVNGPWNPRCIAFLTSNESVTQDADTPLPWDASIYDEYGMLASASDTFVSVPFSGNYKVRAFVRSAAATTDLSALYASIMLDETGGGSYVGAIGGAGTSVARTSASGSAANGMVSVEAVCRLSKNGRIRTSVFHHDTAALSMRGNATLDGTATHMTVEWIPDYVQGVDLVDRP